MFSRGSRHLNGYAQGSFSLLVGQPRSCSDMLARVARRYEDQWTQAIRKPSGTSAPSLSLLQTSGNRIPSEEPRSRHTRYGLSWSWTWRVGTRLQCGNSERSWLEGSHLALRVLARFACDHDASLPVRKLRSSRPLEVRGESTATKLIQVRVTFVEPLHYK